MSDDPADQAETVAAMFHDQADGEAARTALIGAGIPPVQITLVAQPPAPDSLARSRSIWSRIRSAFLDHHHAHIYAEGVERGRCVVFVRVNGDSARVIALLHAAHPLDVPHHVREWRRAGWSGRHAGEGEAPIPLLFAEHEDLDHIPTTGMINQPETVRPIGAPLVNPMGIEVAGSRQVFRYGPGSSSV